MKVTLKAISLNEILAKLKLYKKKTNSSKMKEIFEKRKKMLGVTDEELREIQSNYFCEGL